MLLHQWHMTPICVTYMCLYCSSGEFTGRVPHCLKCSSTDSPSCSHHTSCRMIPKDQMSTATDASSPNSVSGACARHMTLIWKKSKEHTSSNIGMTVICMYMINTKGKSPSCSCMCPAILPMWMTTIIWKTPLGCSIDCASAEHLQSMHHHKSNVVRHRNIVTLLALFYALFIMFLTCHANVPLQQHMTN